MADKAHVVKLAQKGYDVKTAGDENLIYNSNWPLLKIYKQGTFTNPDITAPATIAEHGLGFQPMYWFFTNTNIGAWFNSPIATDNRSEFFGPIGDGSVSITDKKLSYIPNASPAYTGTIKLEYFIFALDLSKQFNAPQIKVGSVAGGGDNRFVFKLAKDTKSVSSNNLEDFVIHSRVRSPLIHSVNPGTVQEDLGALGKGFTVYHNLGYNPMFFAYDTTAGPATLIATGSGGSTRLTSDTQKVQFSEAAAGRKLTIVILKDPFQLEYSVRVDI